MTRQHSFFILTLIIATFIVKGLFFSTLFPMFQGPDEPIHYNTIHNTAQIVIPPSTNYRDVSQFDEEITTTLQKISFAHVLKNSRNTTPFSETSTGRNEPDIRVAQWRRTSTNSHKRVVKHTPLYSTIGALSERALSTQSIIERFFAMRFIGILFGASIVIIAYHIARTVGLGRTTALLIAAALSFHPMFTFMSGIVNPDILFFLTFSLFLLISTYTLRYGWRWYTAPLLIITVPLVLFSKATGIIVVPLALMLTAYCTYRTLRNHYHISNQTAALVILFCVGVTIATTLSFEIIRTTIAGAMRTRAFPSIGDSILSYLQKSISHKHLAFTNTSYWGNFGWLTIAIPEWSRRAFALTDIAASIGLILYFFSKKHHSTIHKSAIIFLIIAIVTLQFTIRFYDWSAYKNADGGIGTPGRYFLPNIAAHFTLIAVGFVGLFRTERRARIALLAFFLTLIITFLITTFTRIIPYYYL